MKNAIHHSLKNIGKLSVQETKLKEILFIMHLYKNIKSRIYLLVIQYQLP